MRARTYIYSRRGLRDSILDLVACNVNGSSSARRGRKGMTYWQILVLAAVRLGCNLDYDKLQDLAEQHRTLRLMMGLSRWDEHVDFDWRRIQDNLCRLKAEAITAISNLIVKEGHRLVPDAPRSVRGDSFACRTNVHYPTDSALIGDGLRKILDIVPDLAEAVGAAGWRQHKHLGKNLRRLLRRVSRACASRAADREKRRRDAYQNLFALAKVHLTRAAGLHQQATVEFRAACHRHPGVESAIGALQGGNGLERCRDRTFAGYKRYVALGVLGRNLHVLGKIVIARVTAAPAAHSKRKHAAA